MDPIEYLIAQGNTFREQHQPAQALECYAQAFVKDPNSVPAWNNYGNVLREMGHPDRSIPFLEHALRLAPDHRTAAFNLAVSFLLMGDYERGWKQYESRWHYEHLDGTLPNWPQPRWTGQDLQGKTLLLLGEQGLGDCIQFVRFAQHLARLGASIVIYVPDGLVSIMNGGPNVIRSCGFSQDPGEFDFWCPMMSVPGILGLTLGALNSPLQYIEPAAGLVRAWQQYLGPKRQVRVGVCYSGRRDSWINQHKSVPMDQILDLVAMNPQCQWINLQVDASLEDQRALDQAGVCQYPGTIQNMGDTAALIANLDVVVTVDTAVAHLAGAMGRPTWLMLNQYGQCWRWLLDRGDSPWYPSVRIFRQPSMGDWAGVTRRIGRFLETFTI